MKKVIRILLFFFILSFASCDFMRNLAGRPDSAEISEKAMLIAKMEKQKAVTQDSLALVEQARKERERFVRDSVKAVGTLDSLGVRYCRECMHSAPVDSLGSRYYIIIGVFRNKFIADREYEKASSKGFTPEFVKFPKVYAVALGSSDDIRDISRMFTDGLANGACPTDAWIFVNGNENQPE